MEVLNLRVEVPELFGYDISLLQKQLREFAKILITTNRNIAMEKVEEPSKKEDPFACFSGDWGGNIPVNEYCDELRHSGLQTREIEPW